MNDAKIVVAIGLEGKLTTMTNLTKEQEKQTTKDELNFQVHIHDELPGYQDGFKSGYAAALASVDVVWVPVTEDGPWPEFTDCYFVTTKSGESDIDSWSQGAEQFHSYYKGELSAWAPIPLPTPYKAKP